MIFSLSWLPNWSILRRFIARAMHPGKGGNDALARMLLVRYSVQAAIDRAASLTVELLGPAAFIQSPEVSNLLAATHVLSLHPPAGLVPHIQQLFLAKRLRQRRLDRRNFQDFRGAIAERKSQTGCHEDRENKDPEHAIGLATEFTKRPRC
jgi:hypothetical protein